ncbi:DUF1499 domain-containing protein [Prosthecomicrobium sp. N25]|uniref:DUF1499 domain-containing protein n=1 Tax=Prosthecomicrobium sp. N25 TaxID=3129254 RepID=UPI00307844EB
MLYRPIQRRSRAAEWGRRFGALALPVLIIAVAGHRFFGLRADHAVGITSVATILGWIAVVLSAAGAKIIWDKGFLGASQAARGLIYGFIALVPAGYAAWGIYSYPRINDVSTDTADPPLYKAAAFARIGAMNPTRPPAPAELERQRILFPDIETRHFDIGSEQLYAAARRVVEKAGWRVTEDLPAREEGDRARIEAVARTLVFGFEDDVVIRIYAEGNGGSKIDIRSSSRWGEHDFGANVRRIRGFLSDLDALVAESFG